MPVGVVEQRWCGGLLHSGRSRLTNGGRLRGCGH